MPLGRSGKHYFNPKQMAHHGDMPEEMPHEAMPEETGGEHPTIHHIEIHPHGPSSEHPHHLEIHKHDGQMEHGGEHENYDQASEAGKSAMDQGDTDMEEEQMEEEISPGIHEKVSKSESGAY